MSRDDFMEFFRNDELLNTLSVEDRLEIFSEILSGSSDFTITLIDRVFNDYCVTNLEVKEV
jgi:hypothetical protein